MGRNTRLSPYAKGSGEEFDEDASVIEFMSYRSAPSASKGNLPPDDSVPLFLSDHDEEPPRRPSFGRVRSEDSDSQRVLREPVSPRIIKASILAASVVAIVVAIFAVGNPLALFANAKASLAGTAAGLSGAPNQVAAIQRVPEPARAAPEPVVAVRTARRTCDVAEAGKEFDLDRRHRACAIVAETGSGRARGQRRPPARSNLRSGRAREAGYAKHRSRSGVGARMVPEGGAVRFGGCAAAPQPNAELAFTNEEHYAARTWTGDGRHDDGLWLRGAGRRYGV